MSQYLKKESMYMYNHIPTPIPIPIPVLDPPFILRFVPVLQVFVQFVTLLVRLRLVFTYLLKFSSPTSHISLSVLIVNTNLKMQKSFHFAVDIGDGIGGVDANVDGSAV